MSLAVDSETRKPPAENLFLCPTSKKASSSQEALVLDCFQSHLASVSKWRRFMTSR